MIYYPIIGALALATGVIIEKIVWGFWLIQAPPFKHFTWFIFIKTFVMVHIFLTASQNCQIKI